MGRLAAMLTVNILQALDKTSLVNLLKQVFLILPNYCFGQGLADLYENYQALDLIAPYCKEAGLSLNECCEVVSDSMSIDDDDNEDDD